MTLNRPRRLARLDHLPPTQDDVDGEYAAERCNMAPLHLTQEDLDCDYAGEHCNG